MLSSVLTSAPKLTHD